MTDVFWVIASGTDAGKTTFATALLTVLGRRQKGCIAFKPFAVMRFNTWAGFGDEMLSHGRLYGGDPYVLTHASQLPEGGMYEVVNPVGLLVRGKSLSEAIVLRSGSPFLSNHELALVRGNRHIYAQKHVWDLLSRRGLVGRGAEKYTDIRFRDIHTALAGKIDRSYRHLAALEPDVMVCEGAARYLPVWPGSPGPDHVFHVGHREITLFAHVGDEVRSAFTRERLPRVDVLDEPGMFTCRERYRSELEPDAAGDLPGCFERTVSELLAKVPYPC